MDDRIQQMQNRINWNREQDNRIMAVDPHHIGKSIEIGRRGPGDKGYLPPVTDFVTFSFQHGVVVMPLDVYAKLPKYKKNKLLKQ